MASLVLARLKERPFACVTIYSGSATILFTKWELPNDVSEHEFTNFGSRFGEKNAEVRPWKVITSLRKLLKVVQPFNPSLQKPQMSSCSVIYVLEFSQETPSAISDLSYRS